MLSIIFILYIAPVDRITLLEAPLWTSLSYLNVADSFVGTDRRAHRRQEGTGFLQDSIIFIKLLSSSEKYGNRAKVEWSSLSPLAIRVHISWSLMLMYM